MIIEEEYGYNFSEGGDFNVQTASYGQLGQLVSEGKLDMANTGPTVHTPQLMGDNPELTAVFWEAEKLTELGFNQNNLGLGNMISTKSYADEHPEALDALVEAWNEGLSWMAEQSPDDLIQTDEDVQTMGATSKKEAKFIIRWAFNTFEKPVTPSTVSLTDEFAQSDKAALTQVADMGMIPGGWEDVVSYRT
jgi:hypothetical protein